MIKFFPEFIEIFMDSIPPSPGKKRRSWFCQEKGTSFSIAVEPPAPVLMSPSANIEVLELTHFTKSPIVEFGKVTVGQTKTRILRVRNPQDYPQQV